MYIFMVQVDFSGNGKKKKKDNRLQFCGVLMLLQTECYESMLFFES